jgi:hypothetical protein
MNRQAFDLAAKFYRAHEAMKGLWGDQFQERLQPCTVAIKKIQERRRCNELEACKVLVEHMTNDKPHDSGYLIAMALAACVEMIGGSK